MRLGRNELMLGQQLQVTLQGGKSSVPLNFLHVVLGKDAFPSVTDRTLFYNTDDEMKKVIKQSQATPQVFINWCIRIR